MGKKMQKRTKKFVKNSLDRTVKIRRQKQKFARKDSVRAESRKARAELKQTQRVGERDEASTKKVEELNVDEFLEGKFFASDDESGAENDDFSLADEDDESIGELPDHNDSDEGDEADDSDVDMGGMDEAAFHKMQLQALKKNDPEFYQHLEKHDKSLLNFQVENEDDEDVVKKSCGTQSDKPKTIMDVIDGNSLEKADRTQQAKRKLKMHAAVEVGQDAQDEKDGDHAHEEEGDDEVDEEQRKRQAKWTKKKRNFSSTSKLTLGKLKNLKQQVLQHSKPALKQLLRAFRAAAHISDDAQEGTDEKLDVTFADSKVFNNVVRVSFQLVPTEFLFRLGTQHTGTLKSNPNWPSVAPLVRSYLGNLVHFVTKVLDITMIRLVLAHLESVIIYFEPFHKLALKFLKALLGFWSTSEEDVRIDAFLRIRQLALSLSDKSQLLENALKGIYLTFVRHSNFASKESMPTLNFMANCVVELYSLEPVSSYQHGFVYIRQLAIHLRNAIHAKTKEAHRGVYNWKYVSCLRVWALLLSAHGSNPDSYLYPLVYPLVQVCIGVLDLLPSSRYYPLRFNVIGILNKLAEATHTYIPLGSYLLDAVHTALVTKKPKKSMGAPPTFQYILKVTKATAASKGYQTAIVTEAMNLLLKHMSIYSYSVAFPELAIPVTLFLKREKKACTIARLKKPISQFLVKLETNSQYIIAQRGAIEYTPQDAVNAAKKSFKQLIFERNKNTVSPLDKFVKLQTGMEITGKDGRLLSAEEMHQESRSRKLRQQGDKDEEGEDFDDDEVEDEDEVDMGEEGGLEGYEDEGDSEEVADEKAAIASELKMRKRNTDIAKIMQSDEAADQVEDFVLSDSDDDAFSKQPLGKIFEAPSNHKQFGNTLPPSGKKSHVSTTHESKSHGIKTQGNEAPGIRPGESQSKKLYGKQFK